MSVLVAIALSILSSVDQYEGFLTTLKPNSHRLSCSGDEKLKTACFNGGSCFAIDVGHRIVQCGCPPRYAGSQCEMINPFLIYQVTEEKQDLRTRTALIVASCCFIVAVVIIFIVCFVQYIRNNKRNEYKDSRDSKKTTEHAVFI